jgi:hypothetical protein
MKMTPANVGWNVENYVSSTLATFACECDVRRIHAPFYGNLV